VFFLSSFLCPSSSVFLVFRSERSHPVAHTFPFSLSATWERAAPIPFFRNGAGACELDHKNRYMSPIPSFRSFLPSLVLLFFFPLSSCFPLRLSPFLFCPFLFLSLLFFFSFFFFFKKKQKAGKKQKRHPKGKKKQQKRKKKRSFSLLLLFSFPLIFSFLFSFLPFFPFNFLLFVSPLFSSFSLSIFPFSSLLGFILFFFSFFFFFSSKKRKNSKVFPLLFLPFFFLSFFFFPLLLRFYCPFFFFPFPFFLFFILFSFFPFLKHNKQNHLKSTFSETKKKTHHIPRQKNKKKTKRNVFSFFFRFFFFFSPSVFHFWPTKPTTLFFKHEPFFFIFFSSFFSSPVFHFISFTPSFQQPIITPSQTHNSFPPPCYPVSSPHFFSFQNISHFNFIFHQLCFQSNSQTLPSQHLIHFFSKFHSTSGDLRVKFSKIKNFNLNKNFKLNIYFFPLCCGGPARKRKPQKEVRGATRTRRHRPPRHPAALKNSRK